MQNPFSYIVSYHQFFSQKLLFQKNLFVLKLKIIQILTCNLAWISKLLVSIWADLVGKIWSNGPFHSWSRCLEKCISADDTLTNWKFIMQRDYTTKRNGLSKLSEILCVSLCTFGGGYCAWGQIHVFQTC